MGLLSHRFRVIGFLLLCLLGTGQALAMWTEAGDAELVESSGLIIEASYIGQTTFSVGSSVDYENAAVNQKATALTLGVLQITKVFKGSPELKQVFIRLPNPALFRKSDDIIYSAGQSGLWFLRADAVNPGLYLADHPQRFVPEAQQAEKLSTIQKLLN